MGMISNRDSHAGDQAICALAERVAVIVLLATAEGGVSYANPCWTRWTGQPLAEALGDGYLACIHEADRGRFAAAWNAARISGSEKSADVRLRLKSEDRHQQHASFSPLHDSAGLVTGWLITMDAATAAATIDDSLEHSPLATKLLQKLAARIPNLLFSFDLEGRIDFIHERWSAIIGTDANTMLGNGWHQFIHPDDIERIRLDVASHIVSGEPYIAEWRIRRSDATYRWVEIRVEASCDDDGAVRWYGTGTDVDQKRRALNALELLAGADSRIIATENVDTVLSRIASAALAGMAEFAIFDVYDDDGRLRRIIVRALDRLSPKVVPVEEFLPPDSNSMHPIAQAVRTRKSVYHFVVDEDFIENYIEEDIRRESWRESEVRSIVSSPMIIDGMLFGVLTLIRTALNIPFDMQDVRIIEEVAQRGAIAMEHIRFRDLARIASAETDEHFHRIADAIPQLMWITDADGTLEWVNKQWLDFTGRTLEEALLDSRTRLVHPDDEERVWATWRAASAKNGVFQCEYRMLGHDGEARWFLSRATPVETPVGLRWYGTNTDIDDAKRETRTSAIFADVGEALSESLGLQATLDAVTRIAAPRVADWALITLADDAGDLYIAKVHHPDASIDARLARLVGRLYARGNNERGSPAAVRARRPLVLERATYEDGVDIVERDVLDELWQAGFASGIVIPLIVGSIVRGALTLFMSESARTVQSRDVPFYMELGRRIAPAIANAEVYERECRVAQSFQQAALPSKLPVSDCYIFSAVYEAGRSEALVGGDWYDAFKLLDGRFIVSIGDVAGSGLRAAVTMANIRQAIRGVAHVHADPELMLEAADRALRSEDTEFFATAFVGVVDPLARTIAYKNAGHPAPLLTTLEGRITELHTEGLPLGLREPDRAPATVHPLPIGSVLVLYTDGLTESTRNILDGEARLREVITRSRGTDPAERAKTLYDRLLTVGPRDDVAILCMTAIPARRLYWKIDVCNSEDTMKTRSEILAEIRGRSASSEPSLTAELVLAELIGNLVRYAPGLAEIALEWDGERTILHVRDNGPGFAFSPRLPNDLYSENGRGLFLIAALSDEFNVTRRPEGGSHARVVFTL